MRKLLGVGAVGAFLLATCWSGNIRIHAEGQDLRAAVADTKGAAPDHGALQAPAKGVRKSPDYKVCSADFALTVPQRQEAIRKHVQQDPRAINRLLIPAGAPGAARPGGPRAAEIGDLPQFAPGAAAPASAEDRAALVRQGQRIALIWGTKWPNGSTLHVRFFNTHPSWAPIKAKVEQYAHEWENYANIKFVFDDSPQSQIRILLSDDGFSWSNFGREALLKPADQETMHYGWFDLSTPDEEFSRTVIHEFGHALGAIHEHQHPDAGIMWNKPAVYAYYASAKPPWTKEDVDANMFAQYDRSILQYGVYDKDSIMEYPIPPTWTTNGFSVGWNKVLSAEDKAIIAWVYPKTP